MAEHLEGRGSAWTAIHKPLSVEKVIENADSFDEDKWTKRYMAEKGIDKVRGGSYSAVSLDGVQREALDRELKGAADKCFNCGSPGHFVAECRKTVRPPVAAVITDLKCYRCGRTGHIANDCYANTYVSESHTSKCFRCGRSGHFANDCYAKTDSKGYYLDDSDDSWD